MLGTCGWDDNIVIFALLEDENGWYLINIHFQSYRILPDDKTIRVSLGHVC